LASVALREKAELWLAWKRVAQALQHPETEKGLSDAAAQVGAARVNGTESRDQGAVTRPTSMSRRNEDAHAMLAAIHGWFTEGFDTVDLRDAKAFIE
jgi:hypothetical protein